MRDDLIHVKVGGGVRRLPIRGRFLKDISPNVFVERSIRERLRNPGDVLLFSHPALGNGRPETLSGIAHQQEPVLQVVRLAEVVARHHGGGVPKDGVPEATRAQARAQRECVLEEHTVASERSVHEELSAAGPARDDAIQIVLRKVGHPLGVVIREICDPLVSHFLWYIEVPKCRDGLQSLDNNHEVDTVS
jgi:hypothetical protein